MGSDEYKYSRAEGGTALLYYDWENRQIENIVANINPGKELDFLNWAVGITHLPEATIYQNEHFQKILIANSEPMTNNVEINQLAKDVQYQFKEMGDFWALTFEDEKAIIKNLRGLYQIRFLLENPNRSVSAQELFSLNRGGLVNVKKVRVLDRASIQDYTDQISYLTEELAKRTILEEDTEDIELEINQIEEYIKRNGRRVFRSEAENARTAVHKNIRYAVTKIKANMPKLAIHLDKYIQTGDSCCYTIDSTLGWKTH